MGDKGRTVVLSVTSQRFRNLLIFLEKPRKGLVLGNEIPKPLFYIAFIGVLRTLP